MRLILSLCFILLACNYAQASPDTVFLDKNWKECKKDSASYFRPVFIPEEGRQKHADYYISGTLQMEGYTVLFHDIVADTLQPNYYKDGAFNYYYEDGKPSSYEFYVRGKKQGSFVHYREHTGEIQNVTNFKNNYKHGTSVEYYPGGKVSTLRMYDSGYTMGGVMYDISGKEIRNIAPDISPEPGYNVNKYIATHLVYPREAKEQGIHGKVIVRFIVDGDGKLIDPQVVEPLGGGCDEEALRIVKSMPNWIPALINNKPRPSYYTLPIKFVLP